MDSIGKSNPKLYEVLDDVLPMSHLWEIQKVLNDRTMPFYWHDDIDYQNGSSDIHNYGFSHQLYSFKTNSHSEWLSLYFPIVESVCNRLNLQFEKLLRMRIVLTTNVGSPHTNQLHVDLPEIDCFTIVYYPETTDGDFTLCLENKNVQIEPMENRCIAMFKNIGHHGSNPIQHKKRIAINANFLVR